MRYGQAPSSDRQTLVGIVVPFEALIMSFEVDPAPRSSRTTGSASVPIAPGDHNASCESQEGIDTVGSDPTTTISNVPSSCEPSTTRWHLAGKTGVGTYTDLPKNQPSPALTRHASYRRATSCCV